MRVFCILPILCLVQCTLSQATLTPTSRTASNRRCDLILTRAIGRESNYVWVCVCDGKTGASKFADGRIQIDLTPETNRTAAQDLATVRCIQHNNAAMSALCNRNGQLFQKKGTQILQKCIHEKPTASELRAKGPFRYKRKNCFANFFKVQFPFRGGSWVCRCEQTFFYRIVTGLAGFRPQLEDFSEVESSIIDTCSVSVGKDMRRVCRDSPSDFELLGLQLLQVCCKRARVGLDAKFRCADIVPKDVGFLKVPV